MKMTHRGCGGIVVESNEPPYESEEFGIVPIHRCFQCQTEIVGDSQIEFIPENESDKIQIEALERP
jgi:hypothetical protein